MKILKTLLTAVFISLFFNGSLAVAASDPLKFMNNLADQMLTQLDQLKDRSDAKIFVLVKKVLIPHIDLKAMSRAVVGRNAWQAATPALQQQFTQAFTKYVINTYAAALKSYDGEKMQFLPLRGAVQDRVKLNSNLMLKSGSRVQLQYSLKQQNNSWLVYDFSVNGISLVKNYNAQFAATLRQQGLAGLVKQLQKGI